MKKLPVTGALSFSFTPESSQNLIVFVHGVFGDPSLTWTNQSGVSWPDLVEQDKQFQHFRVATYRYESLYLQRTSSINEIAVRMLRQLEDEGVFEKYKEIYFIAHSMGGLVVKRVLVDLNRPTQTAKLRKVKAVLYISTPAQGANSAEVGSWLSVNPQLRDMRPADFNTFLQTLEDQWQNLLRDRRSEPFPQSFCAHETKPTHGIMIVSRVYAATLCDQNSFPVDEDHANIAKPGSVESDIYLWARARILQSSVLARGPRLEYGLWKTPYSYKSGLNVEGVEWKEHYREYIFTVKNPSKRERVVDLRLRFEFPWPVIVSRFTFQQGCESLAIAGSDDEPFHRVRKNQVINLDDIWTNVLNINAMTMYPDAVLHGKLILITDQPPSNFAMLRVDYRDGTSLTRKSFWHRISVLDAAAGTVKIEHEDLKGEQEATIIWRFKEPVVLKER
ncbi:MAG: hypothetical protein MRJ68_18950 [Nitrospira sp.]|nr:hypothetical protein [Nitrospira sp.]